LQRKVKVKLSIHVLVVDDNLINRQYFSMAIKKLGYKVQLAESGQEAIQFASNSNFDIILMDIRMPEMDGFQTATQIRLIKNHISTPIIAISAENSSEAQNSVFNGFILKPVSPVQLKQNIEKYCQNNSQKNTAFDQSKAMKFAYNDKDIMDKIIDLFIKDIPIQIDKLDISINHNNISESTAIIHKILGSCQACGAIEIAKNLEILSSQIKTNEANPTEIALRDLKISIRNFETHFNQFK